MGAPPPPAAVDIGVTYGGLSASSGQRIGRFYVALYHCHHAAHSIHSINRGVFVKRRVFLKTGMGMAATAAVGGWARPGRSAGAQPDEVKWRAFEVVTRAEVANATGATRVWLPLPLQTDTDYFKSLG